jgi:CheY-specific phosphatase CheX
MSKQFDSALFHAARDTFENLAFMLSLEEGDSAMMLPPARRTVTVNFSGPYSGQLVVSLSPTLMPEIATSMLGLENAEPSPTQQEDAFKELANVICGNLLPALAGTQVVFAVSAPILMAENETPAASARTPAAATHLTLENGVADLTLFVNHDSGNDLAAAADQQISKECR